MLRLLLSLGLIANGALFGAGIWRSVMFGQQAFHTFADIGGYAGVFSGFWIWPVVLLILAGWIVLINRNQPKSKQGFDDE